MRDTIKRYALYLVRWQLSTPILAACVYYMTASLGATWTTVIANFVGGMIFFWVDRWIFTRTNLLGHGELWQAMNNIVCADCGHTVSRGYRLVKTKGYDRTADPRPEFRCDECSQAKYVKSQAENHTSAGAS
jgi:hypothetical protein